jgi:hypothetical protein
MTTNSPYRKPPGKLSPKLAQALKDATPEQIKQASKIAAALLLAKAKKKG